MNELYSYGAADDRDLEILWNRNIERNEGDARWKRWKEEYIGYQHRGMSRTFVVRCDGIAVGEGTLLFSPDCKAIRGRRMLADGISVANVNALRIMGAFEGQGHISKMMKVLEAYARDAGYRELTIGVEAAETRNLGIYLHFGYNRLVHAEVEDGVLVLYYAKTLFAG
jgi:GNAT superfamily N-acetyltransferase